MHAKSYGRSAEKIFTGAEKLKIDFFDMLLFAITAELSWRIGPNFVGACGRSVPAVGH